jgi:CRISPR-associated protein (TIGR03984 family)
MERKIESLACQVQPLKMVGFDADPRMWLQNQPCVGENSWFLAHADDGIIWGRFQDGQLVTSNSAFPKISPPLRLVTLQQARIFGHNAEVRVWRNGNKFEACRLEDYFKKDEEAFDEDYLLWGTHPDEMINGFTLVSDGNQGLKHAVPIDVSEAAFKTNHPLCLQIRHYLTYDQGQARIALSRLVKISVRGEKA